MVLVAVPAAAVAVPAAATAAEAPAVAQRATLAVGSVRRSPRRSDPDRQV
ncbi:hypothetical protein SRL2020226_61410 [Mycobacterium kiyosense]|nr:hypothetical protein SRL2020226_61410 [Mycobacterium kiyosense]